MKIIIIVQARTSSSRLPGKVLLPILNRPLIIHLLDRVALSNKISKLILATSTDPTDDKLAKLVSDYDYNVYRGSLDDVLDRFYKCAKYESASDIVRITGDCPLIDPELINELIDEYFKGDWDYIGNSINPNKLTVPDGFDIEIFKFSSLEKANNYSLLPSEREHVTPWMRKRSSNLRWRHYTHNFKCPDYRLTVDDEKDFKVITNIFENLYPLNSNFGINEVLKFMSDNPEVSQINIETPRNEGYEKSLLKDKAFNRSTGQALWSRAKKIIPGGNMLLSKRPEMFLPDYWPSYFRKAKGCKVWDLDGNEFIDMSIMGIGTNSLGYGKKEIDEAVIQTVQLGNMSTLNCPEEVWLAEKLIELHPWADMVRFARTGGEANAIAIRIARAATNRDSIAICGYHGWHDWYLATNLEGDGNLEEHLLPGLSSSGVAKGLRNSVHPFSFNRFDQLELIVSKYDLAAVIMEVQRSESPTKGFLSSVRELCSKKGIVLIFDECTSGFRETYGGLHKKYKINPDIAMFGKALGNGYAITTIIGTEEIMQYAQNSFISSTFWTERIGPTAALKTLEIMKSEESWKKITLTGKKIKEGWEELAQKNNLEIIHTGLNALAGFYMKSENFLKYKTYITQEMLKKGFLASNTCYVCTEHTEELVDMYLEALDPIFATIATYEATKSNDPLLDSSICHSGFKRLN
ncbi:glutamate-1-semialdehyde aminotransferase [bacterium]|nr:glutamate-1-semialdehyde aminotransferase [bacterium]|tara:strand:+ start:646 stop:2718 length:2073 start_codon:yes stop_codon:yes gene_type:complete